MIVNLWSTPRTGSNWYSQYLHQYYLESNKRTILYTQYLNEFQMTGYHKFGYGDLVYDYEPGLSYKYFYYDHLSKAISYKAKYEPRTLSLEQEESYRLDLIKKHNFDRNPAIFYNHVRPTSDYAYKYLFDLADKNIFLYRKDIKRQLSSYALGYGTKQYKASRENKVYENVEVEYPILKNLTDRIVHWYKLDKTNCEIICYEDLDFKKINNLPKQQNKIDPFTQLSSNTQSNILELVDYFNSVSQKIL